MQSHISGLILQQIMTMRDRNSHGHGHGHGHGNGHGARCTDQ